MAMAVVKLRPVVLLQLCVLLLSCCFASADPSPEPFTIRISCGSREDVVMPPTNTLWYRDFGYTGGRYANASRPSYIIPPLKTLRFFTLADGTENCYYINNVPNGHYQVRTFFSLIADPSLDSEPIFDVSVEGTLIHSLMSGWSSIDDQTFAEALVFIKDTNLSVCFHSTGHGDPSILTIEVLQIDDRAYHAPTSGGSNTILVPVKRMMFGAGDSAFDIDLNGSVWGGERFWLGVNTLSTSSNDKAISTTNVIAETSIAPNYYAQGLYQSAIVGTNLQPDLTFQMTVDPNYNYSIWLHFAEIEPGINAELQRIFNVLINGDIVFLGVDIIRMAGERYTAVVLNKTVLVSGTTLKITLRAVKGNRAIISAMEIFKVVTAEMKTSSFEVAALRTLRTWLGLPQRLGWNGDPCVPQQHPWSGVDCQFDNISNQWFIDGIGLDNQGLKGSIPNDISKLQHLQSINLSSNSLRENIPASIGQISGLQVLDLSYNELNGTIPDSLGTLNVLQILNLNGNKLSGKVPANLGGRPLHRASFNFTGNAGLCGIPGLPDCGPHLSVGAKLGIAFGALIAFLVLVVFAACWWKRRQNILRSQKIAAAREAAPYAKARTHFVGRDVQLTRHHRPYENFQHPNESMPHLLP